jgi:LacI family transcriptional regulator
MREGGIEVPSSWIVERPLVREGGESAFNTCMASLNPDAFFCAGDFAALGVMQAALKSRLRIPEDLGITGFANEPFTEFMHPPLTTVDQRGGEMGRKVADMFLNCSEEASPESECEKIILKPDLIIRKSSNPNRKIEGYEN